MSPYFRAAVAQVDYTTRGNRLRELDRGDRFAGKARGGRILKYATDEQRSQRAERPVQNRKM